ncbi:MAG: hypothetical protein OJF60_003465 [Burkholderiaceae bacterium]|jgi:hypothetical protein|nr:MAG: hypothetical protein OJF60_003465 [Burkholderiaceae bacterium]
MFGWLKKRFARRMSGLINGAQMATYLAICRSFGADDAQTEERRSALGKRAAAATNFLFGKSPSAEHIRELDLEIEHASALRWLADEQPYRELIVQSLRIANVAAYASSGKVDGILGERVLSRYGAEFPNALNPAEYEELLNRSIAQLTVRQQEAVRRVIQSSGANPSIERRHTTP